MSKKLGRNEPCWCGSGKKYKKCHFDRENLPQFPIQDLVNLQKSFFIGNTCLYPIQKGVLCPNTTIKSHTLQRGGSLKRISVNDEVFSLKIEFTRRLDPFVLKRVKIREASTFPGFCAFHDDSLFGPIEKGNFVLDRYTCFLLAYRAICREYFTKSAAVKTMPNIKEIDRGRSIPQQKIIQEEMNLVNNGFLLGVRDIMNYKEKYDKILLSNDLSKVNFYVIKFKDTPEIVCSSAHSPTFDFRGNNLQSLGSNIVLPELLTFTLLATEFGGSAVFCWINKSNAIEKFIDSIDSLSDKELPAALVRYTFEYFENMFFSINWWDKLNNDMRTNLLKRFKEKANPFIGRKHNCLIDDGFKSAAWEVEARVKNIG